MGRQLMIFVKFIKGLTVFIVLKNGFSFQNCMSLHVDGAGRTVEYGTLSNLVAKVITACKLL